MKLHLDNVLNLSLYLYIFLLHFEYWDFIVGNLENFSMSKLSAGIYILFYFLRYRKITIKKELLKYYALLSGFYILLLMVSVLNYNSYSDIGNALNFNVLQNFVLFFILTNHLTDNPKLIAGSLKAFAMGGIAISVLCFSNLGLSYSEEGRLQMFGEDPNFIGYRLVFATITIISFITNPRIVEKPRVMLWLPALPLMLLTVVKTGSRGAILCFFLLIVILVTITRSRSYMKLLILLFSVSLIILTMQWIKGNDIIYSRFLLTFQEGDTARRFMIWKNLLQLMTVHPVFGIGETGYVREATKIFGTILAAHNVYLEIFVKTGLAGFILYFSFLFKMFSESYTILYRKQIILPIMFIVGIMFMFTNIQGIYNKSLYFFYAFIIVMYLDSDTAGKQVDQDDSTQNIEKKHYILFS